MEWGRQHALQTHCDACAGKAVSAGRTAGGRRERKKAVRRARVCVGEKNMHKEKGKREQSQERKKREKTIAQRENRIEREMLKERGRAAAAADLFAEDGDAEKVAPPTLLPRATARRLGPPLPPTHLPRRARKCGHRAPTVM